jgi:hypothetical protein
MRSNIPHPSEERENLDNLRSLEQIKGIISRYVPYSSCRAQILRAYHGSAAHDWFLQELSATIPDLIHIESGISFLSAVDQKIQAPAAEWTQSLLENLEALIEFPRGCDLIAGHFSRSSPELKLSIARFMFTQFPELHFSSPPFQNMMRMCIEEYQQDFEALRPLFEFDWIEQHEYISVFCLLLDTVSEPFFEVLIEPFLADVMRFASHPHLYPVIVHLIHRASLQVRARLFARLVVVSDRELSLVCVQKVVCAMIEETTHDQLEQFYIRIAQYFRTSIDCERVVAALLSVGPVRANLHFLMQNVKFVELMKGTRFRTALAALEGAMKSREAFKNHGPN